MKQGKLIILSAPSGAGKTTLVKHLLQENEALEFSVSCCTRTPRAGEVHGKDYYFLSLDDFKNKVAQKEFAEWEEVYPDLLYGTLQSEIERIWAKGKSVIFDIDVVGGLNLKKRYKDQALAIFVNPPSKEILGERLSSRNTESPEKLALRIAKAEEELAYAPHFDVILTNDLLPKAKEEVSHLVNEFLKES